MALQVVGSTEVGVMASQYKVMGSNLPHDYQKINTLIGGDIKKFNALTSS